MPSPITHTSYTFSIPLPQDCDNLKQKINILIVRTWGKRSTPPPPELLDIAEVIEVKIFDIEKIPEEINSAKLFNNCDIAIFMSSIAVNICKTEHALPQAKYYIAVGPETAQALAQCLGRSTTLVLPYRYSSMGIVETVINLTKNDPDVRVVHVYRSAHGSSLLSNKLSQRFIFREFRLYRLRIEAWQRTIIQKLVKWAHVIVIMSSQIAKTVIETCGADELRSKTLVVPGEETAETCRRHGLEVIIAENSDMDSIYRKLCQLVKWQCRL